MGVAVNYKGNTITAITDNTKTLNTSGKYMEANIELVPGYSGTVLSNGNQEYCYVTINGSSKRYYTANDVIIYSSGDVLNIHVSSGSSANEVQIDGTVVAKKNNGGEVSYDYTLPNNDITIEYTSNPVNGIVAITSSLAVTLQSKTATPTESTQTITPDSGYDGLSSVEVGAISSSYVGSGVDRRSSTDLTVSGATITSPAGYYAESASKSVASGTAGTPSASKGTVSNHSVSVTPSVTNTTGYITGGTKTGTAVTVTAAELASGNKAITENGTNIDVVGYSTVSVDVSSSGTPAISVVDTTDSHGGTIRTITSLDISDTTAVASDVTSGKYFYTASGVKTAGTASGSGGTPSATAHTIYFEFSDNTNTTITAYYNDAFISNAITATTPTTYGNKTVTLAQLDNVTWYELSNIPLNTELVDYNTVITGYALDSSGNIVPYDSWDCVTDYVAIDPAMTFTCKCRDWTNVGLYDSNKNVVSVTSVQNIDGVTQSNDLATFTLTPSIIPSNAAFIVLVGNAYSIQNSLSIIRTA